LASGGVGESLGSVVLVTQEEDNVGKAVSIVESIKGEPPLRGFKGTCDKSPHACRLPGMKLEELPSWLSE